MYVTRTGVALLVALLVPLGAWLFADGGSLVRETLYDLRDPSVQLTGVVGIAVMSLGMVLAARPGWLETLLGGLDKMYRLHKWLGIAGLVLALAHWFWGTGIRWLKDSGIFALPESGGGLGSLTLSLPPFYQYTELAEKLGEWAFYAFLLVVAGALVKALPYKWFRLLHKLMAPIYLLLVFHSIVMADPRYWSQPLGWFMGLLMAAGSVGVLISLVQAIGWTRRHAGRVVGLDYFADIRVLLASVEVPGWRGHRPGQFAFLTTDLLEGPHPYSIASPWGGSRLDFAIKELGDHTTGLNERLAVGSRVTVEGPYGRFDFRDEKPTQIWVGAGIGIAPFLARLRAHAGSTPTQRVYFYHTTGDFDARAIGLVRQDAAATDITMRILVDARDGLLSGANIRAEVPHWQSASVWFCGPVAFGKALRQDLTANGLPGSAFHQELFDMR